MRTSRAMATTSPTAPGDHDQAAERRATGLGVVLRADCRQHQRARDRRHERGHRRDGRDPGQTRHGQQQEQGQELDEPRDRDRRPDRRSPRTGRTRRSRPPTHPMARASGAQPKTARPSRPTSPGRPSMTHDRIAAQGRVRGEWQWFERVRVRGGGAWSGASRAIAADFARGVTGGRLPPRGRGVGRWRGPRPAGSARIGLGPRIRVGRRSGLGRRRSVGRLALIGGLDRRRRLGSRSRLGLPTPTAGLVLRPVLAGIRVLLRVERPVRPRRRPVPRRPAPIRLERFGIGAVVGRGPERCLVRWPFRAAGPARSPTRRRWWRRGRHPPAVPPAPAASAVVRPP